MTRADRRTLVCQLHEEGLSQRAIAKRLKVSKDTVRRDLEKATAEDAPDDAPPAETADTAAPQASDAAGQDSAPGDAPQDAPVAHPHAGIDVSQCRGLRHDMALLAQTGKPAEALVFQAVAAVAYAYKLALARGDIEPGVPFVVREMQLVPLRHRATRPAPVPSEAG